MLHEAAWTLVVYLCAVVDSYDVGCLYPPNMPNPIQAQLQMASAMSVASIVRGLETPIVVRNAHFTSYCQSNCVAYHDADALNVVTKQAPRFRTPAAYHNSWSRSLCMAQCFDSLGALDPIFASWGFEPQAANAQLIACGADSQCVDALLVASDWHPQLIGQIVASEIAEVALNDGWNAYGAWTFDEETEQAVPCTANCAPFADTTGYFPVNNPGGNDAGANDSDSDHWAAKYAVRGEDRRWQPMREHDGQGYWSRQEHVTPHIGYTVTPFVIQEWKQAADPRYDYKAEAELVIERLAELAGDDEQKAMTAFFDNKLLVRGLIQQYVRNQYADQTFEEQMLFIHVLSVVEVDALLQAWREKVRHDLVRPTTVIQRWGSDTIHTFNGDRASTAPQDLAARDFQAYQRVMPHSEYPSGSACLCTAYAEVTDLYVEQRWQGDSIGPLNVGISNATVDGSFGGAPLDPQGLPTFNICNPSSHDWTCAPEQEFVLEDMDDLKRVCGQSRLWGGMHFTTSVPAAEELCSGIGALGMQLYDELKAGSSWGETFVEFPTDPADTRDQRPTCA